MRRGHDSHCMCWVHRQCVPLMQEQLLNFLTISRSDVTDAFVNGRIVNSDDG